MPTKKNPPQQGEGAQDLFEKGNQKDQIKLVRKTKWTGKIDGAVANRKGAHLAAESNSASYRPLNDLKAHVRHDSLERSCAQPL